MVAIITVPELSLWAEGTADAIALTDPLALWLIAQASTLVLDECEHPEWTPSTAPDRAKIIVANIARRCWNNADQETRTTLAGGPSSSVIDEAALGLRLSDAEIVECSKVRKAAAPASTSGISGIWTLPITRGPLESDIYLPDQHWPFSSPIPYLTPDLDPYYVPTSDPALPVGQEIPVDDTDFAGIVDGGGGP
mgnify:FL=1